MQSSLSPPSIAALFSAMAVLAAIPSVSLLAVTANAASSGLRHGALTALGVVMGDMVFMLTAVFGLVLLSDALGSAFTLVKYAGAAYLAWLAVTLLRTGEPHRQRSGVARRSYLGSFMTGLLITLGDQKAVLFYLGFLPAFVEMETLTPPDIGVIALVTLVAVGGVKFGYAYAVARAGKGIGESFSKAMIRMAAALLLGAAIAILVHA
ncbi:LysE family translocator [Sinimarinibacterium sp. CAU 1509]|uniref:LysE family translocator n=1 Tax=Sinimarinibacterium sp. CAU 1509 TaxID=2562283 RepID=UPI0010AC345E|nr:LysE family translocator [Sinimarinibacterium sp. CAU 1509]TJY55175.1 LysE family translocator [Sinimarinibacterium sp. CAU 1509]